MTNVNRTIPMNFTVLVIFYSEPVYDSWEKKRRNNKTAFSNNLDPILGANSDIPGGFLHVGVHLEVPLETFHPD